ncbi:hypothetical protein [Occallatibacter savannae]|uniref:hypothetical protein n=1 Tax=Occallatibacter savannae TaxID=1002691 RepID=UPI0013A5553D|nr:hypothetical protein [Occallatibacter savannae]
MAAEMRARRISPEAGRALEILGHAIEYLSDEYVEHAEEVRAADPRVDAIQILMRLNREIYVACPVVPGVGERIMSFLRGYVLRAERSGVNPAR